MRAHAEFIEVRFGSDRCAMLAEEFYDGGVEGGGVACESLRGSCGWAWGGDDIVFYCYRSAGECAVGSGRKPCFFGRVVVDYGIGSIMSLSAP